MTTAEFAAVKSSMMGTRQSARVQTGAVAGTVARAHANGYPVDYFKGYDAALDAVTLEQVNAYIRARYPESLSFVVISPSAEGLGADCVIKALDEAGRCGL